MHRITPTSQPAVTLMSSKCPSPAQWQRRLTVDRPFFARYPSTFKNQATSITVRSTDKTPSSSTTNKEAPAAISASETSSTPNSNYKLMASSSVALKLPTKQLGPPSLQARQVRVSTSISTRVSPMRLLLWKHDRWLVPAWLPSRTLAQTRSSLGLLRARRRSNSIRPAAKFSTARPWMQMATLYSRPTWSRWKGP